jgi:hypothetical protein
MDMDLLLKGYSFSYYFRQVFQSVCVKTKPALGQSLNLQTLPCCVLLLLLLLGVVLISRDEARLRGANMGRAIAVSTLITRVSDKHCVVTNCPA